MTSPATNPQPSTESGVTLPPSIEETLAFLSRRQMILPALLFLAGHRPLAFVCGQCLMVGLPLGILFSGWPLRAWAEVLSHPQGPQALEQRLRDLQTLPSASRWSTDESISQR